MKTKNIEEFKETTNRHIKQDQVLQGSYGDWSTNEGTGCFIGCSVHSNKAEDVTQKFGIPKPLVLLLENIFEGLTKEESVEFYRQIPQAIDVDGKDLSLVVWKFLAAELRTLPQQKVIDDVIVGMDILARGEVWDSDAARAAAREAADEADVAADEARVAAYAARVAARVAYVAYDVANVGVDAARVAYDVANVGADAAADVAAFAARVAAYEAAYVARVAAYEAARTRQAKTILELLKDAT